MFRSVIDRERATTLRNSQLLFAAFSGHWRRSRPSRRPAVRNAERRDGFRFNVGVGADVQVRSIGRQSFERRRKAFDPKFGGGVVGITLHEEIPPECRR